MKYILGLDIGTNSIGWAAVTVNKNNEAEKIIKMGSRIFTDSRNPKDQTTLASHRRQKRHERRRRDRLAQRKKTILNQLIKMGLFPKNKDEQQELKKLDVLTLRSKAASQQLKPYELGRVFYHLSLKRGFQSNRKGLSEEDAKNKISERIENLKSQLESNKFKTVGQFLNSRYQQELSTKAVVENDFHILRDLIKNEFDIIVGVQKKFFKNIDEKDWNDLRVRIFHQRPLRPVETGPCAIFGSDKKSFRTYKFMPSFEEFRFLNELFNLRYMDSNYKTLGLSQEEIKLLFNEFRSSTKISFSKIKKVIKKPQIQFSIEASRAKGEIKVSTTNHFFAHEDLFSDDWYSLSLKKRDQICEAYFSDDSVDTIEEKLKALGVEAPLISKLLDKSPPTASEMTCPYSSAALQKIVEIVLDEMKHPALVVDSLIKNESLEASFQDSLEYYGKSLMDSTQPVPVHLIRNGSSMNEDEVRYGRIANPTVHVALNQLRKVVNEVIQTYGKPESIHIEFARDLKRSKDERLDQLKRNKDNEKRNAEIQKFIEKFKQKPSAFNFERVKLWFELVAMKSQFCIYSGKAISMRMVLSEEVQVDHILPFSRTLDDGLSNKVLVLASENAKKKNRTPYEAFGKDPEKWAAIQERVQALPYKKQWRFSENSIQQFEEQNQFLERHLNDTRYVSKIAKKYLSSILPLNQIVASKGQVTSLIRGKLGLNQFIQNADGSKNRDDHRHHAIDALTVALTSRSYLKKIADSSAQSRSLSKIVIPEPWKGFHKDVEKAFNSIIVSHKLDHGTNGPFMEETCFGVIRELNEYEKENNYKLVTTKLRASLEEKHIPKIRDEKLRELAEKKGLEKLPSKIKRLRIYEVSNEDHEKIGSPFSGIAKITHGKDKKHRKYYQKGDINYLAIWYLPKKYALRDQKQKARTSDYIFTGVKTFDLNANKSDLNLLKPHPAAKLVAKVFKGDTVKLEREGEEKIFIVKSIKVANGNLQFLEVNLGREIEGAKAYFLAFNRLQECRFRKVSINAIGSVLDRGPLLK